MWEGVHTVVLISYRKRPGILFVRRAKNDSHPGMWQIPGGGAEKGETFEQASVRELKEETGIASKPEEHIKLGINTNHRTWHVTFFFVNKLETDLKNVKLSNEHDGKRVFPISHINRSTKFVFVKFGKKILKLSEGARNRNTAEKVKSLK